jgi:hypothetical protein
MTRFQRCRWMGMDHALFVIGVSGSSQDFPKHFEVRVIRALKARSDFLKGIRFKAVMLQQGC